jgi:hypothetical protein
LVSVSVYWRYRSEHTKLNRSRASFATLKSNSSVAYYDGGSIPDALEQVELIAPRACGLLSAAIIRDRQMKDIRIIQGTLHLFEVLVVSMWNGQWRAIEPAVQYIAVLEKEEIA